MGRITSFLLFLLVLAASTAYAEPFRYGIDVLDSERCLQLQGKRVGMITNAVSVSRSGEPGYQVLLSNGVDLKFLMAPEHGFTLERQAGEAVGNDEVGGSIAVYSLYGKTKRPDLELLKTIDVLVFDLQDAGVRCFTYISTMKLAMEACRDAGIVFMVLDRPNPIAPMPVSGFVLDPDYESFVGAAELPFIHGMTVGEIATWLQQRDYPELSLQVVRMSGYRHDLFADALEGYSFRSPSPNLRDFETLLLYPATVMLEATAVSEGRGTEAPFKLFGAPFIDSEVLLSELQQYDLPGLSLQPASFIPSSSKFAGLTCYGIRLAVTDRAIFDPFRMQVAILLVLQKLYPDQLDLNKEFFDKLAGTDRYRHMLVRKKPIDKILHTAQKEVRKFNEKNHGRFLYP
ncbi:conserved hypothetical protein [Chlorobaculum parvum NCIB 8327]|uniref:DUF1343 domain-containing protein n=1 Tax=Chlorobaculum parvum (strain DSM 263 / NCIMB 8327) TaxID=517417 RepID=B3QNZ4_CHLP8|nr:DUF1343 domain-containing protein [Chlorobaculum parvum]ACF11647.1 conserved hypothetical protein [Chlorobaculum parvum NCIB 8327]